MINRSLFLRRAMSATLRASPADRADRPDRADRTDHADRADRADRAVRADRSDRADRPDRADRSGGSPDEMHRGVSPPDVLRTSSGAIVQVDPIADFELATTGKGSTLTGPPLSPSHSSSLSRNSSGGITDPFAAQRAAALRCELSELRDTVAAQAAEIREARAGNASKAREIVHTRDQLREAIRAREDAVAAGEARDVEATRSAQELEAARLRFRARSKRLRARIDAQDAQLETVTGRCSALEAKAGEAFRVRDESLEKARLAEARAKAAEDGLAESAHACDTLRDAVRGERASNNELREQCELYAAREAELRESAALIAQYQQDLAEAMGTIRTRTQHFVASQAVLRDRLNASEVAFVELSRKSEGMALSHQRARRAAHSKVRALEAKVAALVKEKQTGEREARQERDAHIRSQGSTRRQLDTARRALSDVRHGVFLGGERVF